MRPALPKTMREGPQGPSQAEVNGRLRQLREGNELEQEAAQALDSQEFRPRSQSVLQPAPRWGSGASFYPDLAGPAARACSSLSLRGVQGLGFSLYPELAGPAARACSSLPPSGVQGLGFTLIWPGPQPGRAPACPQVGGRVQGFEV